jgi:hypothetical protein
VPIISILFSIIVTTCLPLLWVANEDTTASPLVAVLLAVAPLRLAPIPRLVVESPSVKSMCIVTHCFRGK